MPDTPLFQIAFSLPGSKDLYFFECGKGEDQFHFQAFDRNQSIVVFEGVHQKRDLDEVLQAISKWELKEKPQNILDTMDGYESLVENGIRAIHNKESQKIVLAAVHIKYSETKVDSLFKSLYLEHSNAFVYALIYNGRC